MATLMPGIPPSTRAFSRIAGKLFKNAELGLAAGTSALEAVVDMVLASEIVPLWCSRRGRVKENRKSKRDDLDRRKCDMARERKVVRSFLFFLFFLLQ